MVNYYELLEISQNASKDEIGSAIKKARRIWNNRANNPDGRIRSEAEQHIREIAEAEKILLDDSKRREYDQELAQGPRGGSLDRQPSESSDNWEDEFFRAYDRDMNDYAAQIAKQAINSNDRNGRAWFLYGEALRRGGNTSAAIAPLQRASMFLSDDARVFRQLAFAYIDSDQPGEALKALFDATRCDPDDSEFYCLRAMIFRSAEMIDEALDEAKKAYKMSPNDDNVRFEYFFALYEDVLRSISYNRSSGKHLITNKAQLDYSHTILKEMAMTIPQDENKGKCTSRMDEIVKIVADAESKKGGFFTSKIGYQYNYDISNAETRASGKH